MSKWEVTKCVWYLQEVEAETEEEAINSAIANGPDSWEDDGYEYSAQGVCTDEELDEVDKMTEDNQH